MCVMYARKRDMMESMLSNAIIALHGSIPVAPSLQKHNYH